MPAVKGASLGECMWGEKSRVAGGKVRARHHYPFCSSHHTERSVRAIGNWKQLVLQMTLWGRAAEWGLCQSTKTRVLGFRKQCESVGAHPWTTFTEWWWGTSEGRADHGPEWSTRTRLQLSADVWGKSNPSLRPRTEGQKQSNSCLGLNGRNH